jgi:apolipoprotein D and lipocalin family protein
MKNLTATAALCCALALSMPACKTITELPIGTHLAENFDASKFEGSWYQIARVPNKAEAGITNVKTSYLRQPDGQWQVSDLGWKNEYGRWVSRSKVSLNRPETAPGTFLFRFNEPRHVLALDPTFKYAIVSGSNLKLLWILSRTPDPNPGAVEQMLTQAKDMGFPLEEITFLPVQR